MKISQEKCLKGFLCTHVWEYRGNNISVSRTIKMIFFFLILYPVLHWPSLNFCMELVNSFSNRMNTPHNSTAVPKYIPSQNTTAQWSDAEGLWVAKDLGISCADMICLISLFLLSLWAKMPSSFLGCPIFQCIPTIQVKHYFVQWLHLILISAV